VLKDGAAWRRSCKDREQDSLGKKDDFKGGDESFLNEESDPFLIEHQKFLDGLKVMEDIKTKYDYDTSAFRDEEEKSVVDAEEIEERESDPEYFPPSSSDESDDDIVFSSSHPYESKHESKHESVDVDAEDESDDDIVFSSSPPGESKHEYGCLDKEFPYLCQEENQVNAGWCVRQDDHCNWPASRFRISPYWPYKKKPQKTQEAEYKKEEYLDESTQESDSDYIPHSDEEDEDIDEDEEYSFDFLSQPIKKTEAWIDESDAFLFKE
jgi:hypothetical protein